MPTVHPRPSLLAALTLLLAASPATAADAMRTPGGRTVILDIDSQSQACRVGRMRQGTTVESAWLQSAAGVGFIQPDGTAASCWSAAGEDPQVAGLGHDYGTVSAAPLVAIVLGQQDLREARLKVSFMVSAGTSRRTFTRSCSFPQGAASQTMVCQNLPNAAVQLIDTHPGDGVVALAARMPGILGQLAPGELLIDILAQKADTDGVIQKAEGYFNWWTSLWECAVEDIDFEKCVSSCGHGNVSVSATPEIPSNNPFAEPACEVTCNCNDGGDVDDKTWTDQPQTQTSFGN